jgi:hypothetical protein
VAGEYSDISLVLASGVVGGVDKGLELVRPWFPSETPSFSRIVSSARAYFWGDLPAAVTHCMKEAHTV